jgi:hypothetical protein
MNAREPPGGKVSQPYVAHLIDGRISSAGFDKRRIQGNWP